MASKSKRHEGHMASVWDDHPYLTDKLKELWELKLSASKIAAELGHGISRCSVIGKAHRMGLTPHGPPTKFRPPSLKVTPMPKPTKIKPIVDLQAPAPAVPPETFAPPGTCHHISGDPLSPGWQMCGNPRFESSVWCEYHRIKCIDLVATARVRAH